MVVSRDINVIITPDAAPKNACGRGTGNKYVISHSLMHSLLLSLHLAIRGFAVTGNPKCLKIGFRTIDNEHPFRTKIKVSA